MADKLQALRRMLRDVLEPLLAADGGELYLVELNKKEVKLHLGGQLNGCPGAAATSAQIVGPAVKAVCPKLKLTVTSGWTVPKGAERIGPD